MSKKEKSAELLEYFNGLSLKEVLGLARKSFILLDENTKFEAVLKEIREIIRFPLYTNSTKPLSQIDFLINLVNEFEKNREKIINKINEVLKDERD